ncbi:uncharacterized protein SOCE26_064740 [Sorangium cellulosum]|uniref:Uncharacterized protein n=1 Tax=Sorangium cellulosum TaxID=56 RepID=A0A2L0F0C2_SORCE|nr:uncharacterized protein SOCE26_064740 [Sorangium cellulosum]
MKGRGVAFVQLPEARDSETRARGLQRLPGAREAPPPPDVQRALDGIVALLRGEASDLSAVALDMERVPPFHRRVYEAARTIPPGEGWALSSGERARGALLGPLPGLRERFGGAVEIADHRRATSWLPLHIAQEVPHQTIVSGAFGRVVPFTVPRP